MGNSCSGKKIRFGHRMEYLGWKLAVFLVGFLSRQAAIRLADFVGWFMWRILGVRKSTVQQNLQIAFGGRRTPEEIDRIALHSMQGTILTFIEFVRPKLIGEFGGKVIGEIENREYGAPLVDKPTICVLAHIGNWEAIAWYASFAKIKFKVFVKFMHNPLINEEVLKLREKLGVAVVPATEVGKAAVDALRDGQWLSILSDQDASARGIFVDFFGRPASTFKGAGMYSWKFNIPIMPAFMIRLRDKQRSLKLVILPPIYPNPTAEKEEEITRLTQLHVKALESVIERYPDSYFWIHKRWKTQPISEKCKEQTF